MYTNTANVEIEKYVKWSLRRLVKNNGKTLTPQSSGSGSGLCEVPT